MLEHRITFIGPGVMAEAMIAGLLHQKLATPKNIIASGPRLERGEELRKKYGIQATTDNAAAASQADVVVLSVKPQRLTSVMTGLHKIRLEALVLSIVAGMSIQKIGKTLKHQAVVRSMPNTPGQIGEGITVWTASPKTPGTSARRRAKSWERWGRKSLLKMRVIWTWPPLCPAPARLTSSSSLKR
jgi:pyrroline-5-carboxylate reductase